MSETFTKKGTRRFKSYYYQDKYRCSGVHSFLSKLLYPSYQSTPSSITKEKKKERSKQKGRPRSYGKLTGFILGKRVDKQMSAIVIGERVKNIDPLTSNLLNALQAWGVQPIESQQIVGIGPARLATEFDLLCENKKGEKILVEVKSRFEGYFDESKKQVLQHPDLRNKTIPSCPKTHAVLQAYTTAKYFEESRKDTPLHHVWVLRTDYEGCTRTVVRTTDASQQHKIPSWLPDVTSIIDREIDRRRNDH